MLPVTARFWKPGSTVADRQGSTAILLAPTWNGFAWLKYECQHSPSTVPTYELKLIKEPGDPLEMFPPHD